LYKLQRDRCSDEVKAIFPAKLKSHEPYQAVYQSTIDKLNGKERDPTSDPQDELTEMDMEVEDLVKLFETMLKDGDPKGTMAYSLTLTLLASAGRGDEGRRIFLCDLIRPKHLKHVGKVTPFS